MPKRISLPSADQMLVGGPKAAPTTGKHKGTKALTQKGAKMPDSTREHISTYLTTSTLKELEEVRTRLFVEENQKLTKAELIERAIRLGLKNPKELLK